MHIKFLGLLAAAVILVVAAFADLDGSHVLNSAHAAIQYASAPVDDPVARLQRKLDAKEAVLEFHADLGYLPSLLKNLGVPVSSQTLVFSKTSFQAPRISPHTPRAIYFNDNATVGYVRGGDVIELAVADPRQGTVFYTLDQEKRSAPRFDRQDQCLQCHASGATLGVPGLVVRSVFPDRSGMPVFPAGSFITDHRSPFRERWGGWYVTGKHGADEHMGNTFVQDKEKPDLFDRSQGSNVTDLTGRFDTGAYLSPHSDLVALMVLEHQTRMQNLITRVGWETRMALFEQAGLNKALGEPAGTMSDSTRRRIYNPAEELVRYMLFADEAPLRFPVSGTSRFAPEYSDRGPLYELDLSTKLYRHSVSPLIYSEAFDALPDIVKQRVYLRLWDELRKPGRAEARRILAATKRGLPAYWQ